MQQQNSTHVDRLALAHFLTPTHSSALATATSRTEDRRSILSHTMACTNLADLPDDVFLHVASHLNVSDILTLRIVCGCPFLPHLNHLTATDVSKFEQSHAFETPLVSRGVRSERSYTWA